MSPLSDLGADWGWALLGLVLATGEMLVPGIFLLWFGMAALGTAVLVAAVPIAFPAQLLLFAALALVAVGLGRRFTRRDRSGLARRGHDLVGRSFVLTAPIAGGIGRWHAGDTSWRIAGPDLAAGVPVRIVALDGATLVVEPMPDRQAAEAGPRL